MFKMFVFLSQYNSPVDVVVLGTELPRDIVAQMYNLVALLEIHSIQNLGGTGQDVDF